MAIGLVDMDSCGDAQLGALGPGWSESTGGAPGCSTSTGTFGGYGISFSGSGQQCRRSLPAAYNTLFWGSHVNLVASGDGLGGGTVYFREGSIVHFTISWVRAEQRISVRKGAGAPFGATLFLSDLNSFPQSVWNYCEFKVIIHDTLGEVSCWLYGLPDPLFSATGIDTRNGGTGFVDNLKFFGASFYSGDQNGVTYFDDMYWVDGSVIGANKLGSCRVTVRVPNSDGSPLEWDPSTGVNHFALVDERPFSATDFVSTSVPNERDLYGITDDGVDYEVQGVRVIGQMKKTDASPTKARLIIKEGAAYGNGADRNLSTTAAMYADVFPNKPSGPAWDTAAVDALLIGAENRPI